MQITDYVICAGVGEGREQTQKRGEKELVPFLLSISIFNSISIYFHFSTIQSIQFTWK